MAIDDIEKLNESELAALIKKAGILKLKIDEEKKKTAKKEIRIIAKKAGLIVSFREKKLAKKLKQEDKNSSSVD